MRVLLADKLSGIAVEHLEAAGHSVVVEPTLNGEALVDAVANHAPRVLVVRSTKVPESVFAASSELALVVRAGAGTNTIDLDAAGRHGVFVSNCPGKNADAVAELAMGLMVAIDRRLPDNVAAARASRWDKKTFSASEGLAGRTLALIGFGQIGRGVARRAQAFGMDVVAWSRSLTDETAAEAGIRRAASPLEAARGADVLSIHLAQTDQTRGLIGAEIFDALPDGAIVINTARAGVVDQDALLSALERKGLRCGLDVFDGEPASKQGVLESPLASHPQVYLTHHIGASTQQAQEAVALEVVRVVAGYADSGDPPNCVNLLKSSVADHVLVVRHRDRVGVLASVLECLRGANINVQEMENRIFQGNKAAVARIYVNGDPSKRIAELQALDDVLHTSVRALGGQ